MVPINEIVPRAKKVGPEVAADATVPGIKKDGLVVSTGTTILSTKKFFVTLFVLYPSVSYTLAILNTKASLLITDLSQNKPFSG